MSNDQHQGFTTLPMPLEPLKEYNYDPLPKDHQKMILLKNVDYYQPGVYAAQPLDSLDSYINPETSVYTPIQVKPQIVSETAEDEKLQSKAMEPQFDFNSAEDEELPQKPMKPQIDFDAVKDEDQNPTEKPEPAQPALISGGKSSRSTKKRNASSKDIKPAKLAKITNIVIDEEENIEALAAPSKSCLADVNDTDDFPLWSIEPVCENGIRLDFFASEPNAASVIRTLFEKIYEPVLATLRMKKLDWDNVGEHEIGPFLTIFNNKVKFFRRRNPKKALLSKEDWRVEKATQFRIICELACRLAIPDQTVLNKHYGSFSNGTYGETDYEQFQSILDQLKIKEDDIFIDVGSGIGQLVTFAAAYSKCANVSGIEIEQVPADFASENGIQFERLMNHFGEQPRPFKLEKGDFKENKHAEFLKNEAKVIFCNNFAFDPDLMLELRKILESCGSGTKIVVTKKLETTRSENGLAHDCFFTQMAETTALQSTGTEKKPNVSWTIKTIDYFLTIMDLEKPIREAEMRAKEQKEHRWARQTRSKRSRAAKN
ncbi:Protein CBG10211 [Caenorhabditis briggsae]|uniref:Histone-lysine N-methyltransferase, H3 lysine-79 specific n=2 Tax=Caenorhabditis briggsae TaxID=6238 RepID=A0AAE8ZUZ2_CAEBR|nr:Protein CBG10211 [Caenorhabditis briggsae]ULT85147.1 hypothetical protein L3Y34_013695 [Caenorhabditis briggsae]CAP29762.1 Protein CBG10211 [Caenorhabditis briggsae]